MNSFLSRKKTKHIKAIFFFIKDRIDDGEMKVVSCLTKRRWADVLTKWLQGLEFQKMRGKLMNCTENYEDIESIKEVESAVRPVSSVTPPRNCKSVLREEGYGGADG